MANIVEIVIKGIDRTKDGFTSPIKSLKDLEVAAGKVAPLFIGIATAAEAAFIAMAKHFINTADEMGKMAQKAGTTTETFSRMAYAGNLAGVSAESLKNGFKFLNQQLVEANQGSPETLQLFKDLGITSRDSATAIAQIAQRFSETEDNADKTTAAVKLFGKAGADMIPLLNAGADGLKEMSDEADAFHQTISKDTAKSAEEFNDNLTRLKLAIQGVVNAVTEKALPSLEEFSSSMIRMIKENGILEGTIGTLIDIFRVLKFVLDSIVYSVKLVYDAFVLFGNYIGNAVSAWIDGLKIFGGALQDIGAIAKAVFTGNFSDARVLFDGMLQHLKDNFEGFKSGLLGIGDGLKKDWAKLWQDMAQGPNIPKLALGYEFDGPFLGPPLPPKQSLNLHTTQTFGTEVQTGRDEDKAYLMELELQSQLKDGIGQLMAEEDLRYAARLAQIGKLNIAEEESVNLATLAAAAHGKAAQKLSMEISQGVSGIFGNMAEAAKAFGKKGFAAFKAFATAQALVNTYSSAVGAYNAMASIPFVGPALAVAAAAAAIAAGLANVAQINSTQPAGQAHAGLDYVPAESTYMLSAGERVLAPKQNEDLTSFLNGSGGGGMNQTIVLNLDGHELARWFHDGTRNGTIEIDARAVT